MLKDGSVLKESNDTSKRRFTMPRASTVGSQEKKIAEALKLLEERGSGRTQH